MAKSLAIYGATGIGKTYNSYNIACEIYGKSSVLLVRSLEQLIEYKKDRHICLIFDDISFEFKKAELLIHLTDRFFDAPVRILRKCITIDKDCIKIFTHNNREAFQPFLCTIEQLEAIERRLNIIEVTNKNQICQQLVEILTPSLSIVDSGE